MNVHVNLTSKDKSDIYSRCFHLNAAFVQLQSQPLNSWQSRDEKYVLFGFTLYFSIFLGSKFNSSETKYGKFIFSAVGVHIWSLDKGSQAKKTKF